MSVLKKKWIELVSGIDFSEYLHPSTFKPLLDSVDEKFSEKLDLESSYELLYNAYLDVYDNYLSETDGNLWKDMPIFISSYKLLDIRILEELRIRLVQYLGFYQKILVDEGVARKLVTHRTFAGNGTSTGNYKNYESDTPQINLTNFDEGIEYATRLEKNDDTRTTNKAGVTDYELKSFNWDEALKNLKMLYYNDLIRYINSIPVLIYNYYALDQYPVCQTVKEYFDYIKTVRGWYAH